MKKSVKILTGILGFIILIPGLAKFREPFKTFIYKHLDYIGFPFPEVMQYVVKFGEVGVGLALLFLAFKEAGLTKKVRGRVFYISNIAIIVMMIVAIYTHLHPAVPAEILPLESKPPVMPIVYIILTVLNVFLYKKSTINYEK
ncbi:hypothetical protein ULMS_06140 [Patiriisocius marinistellae]|uniref:Uncharacterized protein n=1 Tax=Patiriisocius marinistellae TaxID=2494560 RepID=A0A5J4FYB8_9FLAO|nr:hypothetical protein [Patiriisocius marinistellae]GEQ85106.1 hypothetical protein ULMS_06140 [Patiriisocius marinistellae]